MSEYLGVICVPKELLEDDEELRDALDPEENMNWDNIFEWADQYVNVWFKKDTAGKLTIVCSYAGELELEEDINDFADLVREGKPAIIGVTKENWDYFVKLVKKSEADLGRQWFTWNEGETVDEFNPFEAYFNTSFVGIGNISYPDLEIFNTMGYYAYVASEATLKERIYKVIDLIKNRANEEKAVKEEKSKGSDYLNVLTNLTFSNLKELKEVLEEKYDIGIHQINFEKDLTDGEILKAQCNLSDLDQFIDDGWGLRREPSTVHINEVFIFLKKGNIVLWDIWQIQAN